MQRHSIEKSIEHVEKRYDKISKKLDTPTIKRFRNEGTMNLN
jgi:hypothetical protein